MRYDINIRHLEYFITTAKLGSINKAAQVHFISQPSLGKIIRELESTLQTQLFTRSRSGVALTPSGMAFLERAERILREMDSLSFQSAAPTEAAEPLAVSMTRFSHIMECFTDVLLAHKDEPAFVHHLYEGTADDVVQDVYSGRVNVGVLHFDSRRAEEIEAMLAEKGLKFHFLAQVEPHLVLSSKHPLLLKKLPINLHTLSEYGFLWYLGQCDDYIFQLFDQSSPDVKKMRSKVIYLSSRATLMHLVSVSDFYTIGIHGFDMQEQSYGVVSYPIQNSGFMLEFGYITPIDAKLSDITAEFIQNLKSRLC